MRAGITLLVPKGILGPAKYEAPFVRFEATNNSNSQIILISQVGDAKRLKALFEAIQTLDIVPKGAPNKTIEEQLPLDDPNKLLQSFGAQMYLNENGNRVIVGFGHAAPLFENRGDALSTACDMANDKANQQIDMFSKEKILYSKVLNEIDKSEDFEKEGQKLYRSMQGRDYSLLIQGQAEITNFVSESIGEYAIKDSRYGATDCVAIRMWSPEGVQASNKTCLLYTSPSPRDA